MKIQVIENGNIVFNFDLDIPTDRQIFLFQWLGKDPCPAELRDVQEQIQRYIMKLAELGNLANNTLTK